MIEKVKEKVNKTSPNKKMKFLKLVGGSKKSRKLIEEFLIMFDFENRIRRVMLEVYTYGVSWKDTPTFKKMLKDMEMFNFK